MTALSRLKTLIFALVSISLMISTATATPFKLEPLVSHQRVWSGNKQTTYLKVAITGTELKADRPPVNVALVIDRSGSMGGQRIQQAKQAALMAIDMLKADDIVSLIAYDSAAELLVPATKLGDGSILRKGIKALRANGSTALHAGTVMGGAEVAKFFDRNNVNRVILLSDGIANIGPSSPQDLAQLGAKLAGQGISVSTIGLGLGYNEDLMARLADSSDGNHSFVESPDQLARLMSLELNDALAVVAQDVKVAVTFPDGVRPVRALGREAEFSGQEVTSVIKDIIVGAERFVLIEVELNKGVTTEALEFAQIKVSYRDRDGERGSATAVARVNAANSAQDMEKSSQPRVMESVVELIARQQQEMAIKLKDEGKDAQALQLIKRSNQYIDNNAKRYKSRKLRKMHSRGRQDAKVIGKKGKSRDWKRTRKMMRQEAYSSEAQMAF